MHNEIKSLSQKHPPYGYRRIRALLKREGHEVNSKRAASATPGRLAGEQEAATTCRAKADDDCLQDLCWMLRAGKVDKQGGDLKQSLEKWTEIDQNCESHSRVPH